MNRIDVENSLKDGCCPIHNIAFLFHKKASGTKKCRKEIMRCPIDGCSVEVLHTTNLFPDLFDEAEEFEISNGPDKLIDALMDCENKNKRIKWRLSGKENEYCLLTIDNKPHVFTIFKSKFGAFSISIACIGDGSPQYKNGYTSIDDAKKSVKDWTALFSEHIE